MAHKILAGIVSEGASALKFHALRNDETAACSSYLVVSRYAPAHTISMSSRCKSKACQKLFSQADAVARAKKNREARDGSR